MDHVPVKADMSDLQEKLEWCHSHDKECEQIAANAKAFFQRYSKFSKCNCVVVIVFKYNK